MLGPEFETGRLPTFDGWTVIEKLGEGGMCAVYRAHPNDGLGPERALKVLTDRGTNATQRFMIEAELLQRIDHPNVVKVHFVERDARPPWIVMDLLQGRDFEERRLSDGATDPEHTARLFADLANGLATVHALGVRHRDIKPANIILGDDGVARLIDFGIARDTSDAHLTQQGFVVGTAAYLPPEIFVEDDAHQIQDSEVADVYALGQTLHEVLIGTSTYPPDGGTQTGLLVQIMRVKLDQPYLDPSVDRPQIPKGLAAVVRKATAQEPSERLQSAGALEEALRRWLVTRTSRAREAPVSIVDPHELPAPPVTEHIPTPDPLPRGGGDTLEPEEDSPRPTNASAETRKLPAPVPPSREVGGILRAGLAGVIGLGGVAALAVGLLAVLVIGLIILVSLRPTPPVGEIEAVVADRWQDLATCRRDQHGELRLSISVASGRAKSVSVVRSTLPTRVDTCVSKVMAEASYPEHREPFTVEVPIRFE